MPVQLTDSSLYQMLLGTGNVVTLWKIGRDLLPRPASRIEISLGIRETPFQIRNISIVCRLAAQVIRVLYIDSMVCSS